MPAPDRNASQRLIAERELDRRNPSSSTEQQSTAADSDADRNPMATENTDTRPLPHAATFLIEQPEGHGSPINDDDPKTALELLKDRIVLEDAGAQGAALSRGNYKVSLSPTPDGWEEPSERAVHLLCLTNTVVPDAREPGTTVNTHATCWIKSVRAVREIVTEYLGADGFAGLTAAEEEEDQ